MRTSKHYNHSDLTIKSDSGKASQFLQCFLTNNDTPFYEPFKPSTFVCQPAAALIITKAGEIEVVSQKCSASVATFPKFAGIGRTASLLAEQLLILGDDDFGTRRRYISIQKPWEGLLAMKYTVQENFPLTQLPHQHSSLVSRNSLTVVGGKFKSRGKLSKFTWTELSLKWENGSAFSPTFIGACSVKLGVDVHIIFGGERKGISMRQVVKIHTTEEIAYELNPMKHRRISHDCELLDSSVVLVSGGLAQRGADASQVLPDELYNITASGGIIEVLSLEQSLKRSHHSLIKVEDRVWALGGRDSGNTPPSKIAEFDPVAYAWSELTQELHSSDTSELVVTPFPVSSLDCVSQCSCGVANEKGRIFGGSETEVRNTSSQLKMLFRSMFTLGLLHYYVTRT